MENVITIVVAVFASTGFWSFLGDYLRNRKKACSAGDRLLLGIAHNIIHERCNEYLVKGYMTSDDYDTLQSIVAPYIEMGGNGSGKKKYEQCLSLPIREEEA